MLIIVATSLASYIHVSDEANGDIPHDAGKYDVKCCHIHNLQTQTMHPYKKCRQDDSHAKTRWTRWWFQTKCPGELLHIVGWSRLPSSLDWIQIITVLTGEFASKHQLITFVLNMMLSTTVTHARKHVELQPARLDIQMSKRRLGAPHNVENGV